MKRVFSAALSLSLIGLSIGPAAPQALSAVTAAACAAVHTPIAPVTALPDLRGGRGSVSGAPSLRPGLSAAGLSLQPLPALHAAPAPAPAPEPVIPVAAGRPTPFALSMRALAAPAQDFQKMSAGESRSAAEGDFHERIGQASPIAAASDEAADPDVEFLVSAPEASRRAMTEDVYPIHLSAPGTRLLDIDFAMRTQLGNLGIAASLLAAHKAKAIGALAQINTAVLRAPGSEVASFTAALKSQGLEVRVGRTSFVPQSESLNQPWSKTVGLKEMAAVIGADKLQDELQKVLGDPVPPPAAPRPGFVFSARAWLSRALGLAVENPVLPWAILDSWVATSHPYIKGRIEKSVDNDRDLEAHGTHTTGTVIGIDRWNYHGRNYNISNGANASEADTLFKIKMAQRDGALGITYSWSDWLGNPDGPVEKLFTQLAAAGMHINVSAGNRGTAGPNTVTGPAIAYYDADLTINGKLIGKVKRIKAIASSDSDMVTAPSSSRGPGSKTIAANPDKYKGYPQKPDEAGMGVNLVAPIPSGTFVPELGGPGEANSGTSFSTPGVFGGLLLLTRGILVLLRDYLPVLPKPELTQLAMDLARFAMTQTAQKVAPADEIGDGFINVWSAFEYAGKVLRENSPNRVMPRVRSFVRGILALLLRPQGPLHEIEIPVNWQV